MRSISSTEPSTGYETLLFDAMAGDQTLFHRMDMVEAGWQAVEPILDAWKQDRKSPIPTYEPGTWGPPEADQLMERDGRKWRDLTVVRDKVEMSETAAERIASLIEGAIVIRDAAAITLTGGHTPDQVYECLADPDRPWRARINWSRVHLFWSDERNVSPDHPESNFGLAYRSTDPARADPCVAGASNARRAFSRRCGTWYQT